MRRRALARPQAALFLVLALSRGLPAQQPGVADSAQEVLLEFRFSSLPRLPVVALAVGDSTYLPVSTLFQALEIEYVFDASTGRARGYYLPDSSSYTIDLPGHTALVGNRTVQLASAAGLLRPPEIYLTPAALRAIFGLRFGIDQSELAVGLDTDQPMPVLLNAQRHAMEARGRRLEMVPEQAPIRFPWRRSAFGAGLLQYEFSANGYSNTNAFSARLGAGAEVAGGDLQVTTDLTRSRGATASRSSGNWSYALPEVGRWPTRIELGEELSNGLQPIEVQGVHVSNEPWQPRRVAGSYVVQGHTAPGWETELFVDGEFYEVARADSLGRVSFRLPLRYGTTFIHLRYSGPAGQRSEEDMRLQVPFTILPRGTLEYAFAAGRRATFHTKVLQATAAYGIAPAFTGRVGLDRIDDTREQAHVAPYAAATARLPGNVLLTGTTAPGTMLGADVGKVTRTGGTFDLAYNAYGRDEIFNPSGYRNQMRLHAFTPALVHGYNLLARLDGESLWDRGSTRSNLEGEVAVNFVGLRPSVVYRTRRARSGSLSSASSSFALSTLFYPGGFAAHWRLPQGTLLHTQMELDGRSGHLLGWTGALSARATRNGQVRISASRALGSPTRIDLSFQMQGPRFRSNTSVFGGLGSGYAQTLAGTISYDPAGRDLVFSGREGLGQGMVRIRPFVDMNGNGQRDAEEETLRAGYIRLNQALPATLEDSGHVTRIEGLAPYTRYTAQVDLGEVENPLWAPAFDAFSFIAQPERVRTLDVPFYPTGTVDGVVNREIPGGTQPIPGLTIRIVKPDRSLQASVPTFGDGAFYAGGLPPGQYRIAPDSAQLAALSVRATPAFVAFTVSTTGEGSPGGSLTFVLRDMRLEEKPQDKAAPSSDVGPAVTPQSGSPAPNKQPPMTRPESQPSPNSQPH